MRRQLDVPRPVVWLAVAFFVVPALLWSLAVWDTRTPSADEVAADRARVESTTAYREDVEGCGSPFGLPRVEQLYALAASRLCDEETVYLLHSDLDRESLSLDPGPWDVASFAVLGMAGTGMLIAAFWAPRRGMRPFLRRTGFVSVGVALAAAEVEALWWLGWSWILEARGTPGFLDDSTREFMVNGALLAGIAALLGASLGVLLRRPVRAVATATTTAVLTGGLLLALSPLDPWLPHVNVEAILFGDVVRDEPVMDVAACLPDNEPNLLWIRPGLSAPLVADPCTPEVVRSRSAATAYLAGGAGLFLLPAGVLVASRRRRAGQEP